MLAILGTILSSVLGGGATGLLGILVQRFFDMKNKSQDVEIIGLNHKNALELRRVELEIQASEYSGKKELATVDGETKRALADIESNARQAAALENRLATEFTSEQESVRASMANDKASYFTGPSTGFVGVLLGIVDFIRGLIRPVLTIYLVVLLTYAFWWIQQLVAKMGATQFTQVEIKDLTAQIVGAVIYLCTVSVVWWFGTRPPKQVGDR